MAGLPLTIGSKPDHEAVLAEADDRHDFMNLRRNRTGIDATIYVSTREGAHGPRVKLYAGRPGDDQPSLSISIDANPRRLEPVNPPRELARLERPVIAWVSLNYEPLTRFWNEGIDWFEEEVDAFKASLKPLPR